MRPRSWRRRQTLSWNLLATQKQASSAKVLLARCLNHPFLVCRPCNADACWSEVLPSATSQERISDPNHDEPVLLFAPVHHKKETLMK